MSPLSCFWWAMLHMCSNCMQKQASVLHILCCDRLKLVLTLSWITPAILNRCGWNFIHWWGGDSDGTLPWKLWAPSVNWPKWPKKKLFCQGDNASKIQFLSYSSAEQLFGFRCFELGLSTNNVWMESWYNRNRQSFIQLDSSNSNSSSIYWSVKFLLM